MKKGIVIGVFIAFLLIVLIVFTFNSGGESEIVPSNSNSLWRLHGFTDIRTQETFRISDFEQPVLLESFAVWCPTCTKQQKETQKLHDEVGDKIITISLDTDPNEDEEKIVEHITNNGFTSLYAISPAEITQSLIDEFGLNIVNAPAVPMVLICNGQVFELGRGVKDVNKLKSEVENNCGEF